MKDGVWGTGRCFKAAVLNGLCAMRSTRQSTPPHPRLKSRTAFCLFLFHLSIVSPRLGGEPGVLGQPLHPGTPAHPGQARVLRLRMIPSRSPVPGRAARPRTRACVPGRGRVVRGWSSPGRTGVSWGRARPAMLLCPGMGVSPEMGGVPGRIYPGRPRTGECPGCGRVTRDRAVQPAVSARHHGHRRHGAASV